METSKKKSKQPEDLGMLKVEGSFKLKICY